MKNVSKRIAWTGPGVAPAHVICTATAAVALQHILD
jgi:hypothetical protein